MSQPTQGIIRTILRTLPIPSLPDYESRLVLLEYPPGFAAPLHNHPVPCTGYIVEGEVASQWEGGEVEYYRKGDSFIDLGETMHVRSENVSKDGGWLRMVNSYVIKKGEANVKMA
jgi:quercetin dioxygenase-like cupin family protein